MTREMKDSGIEWIGMIPKNWNCKKLKYILASPLMYGANESGEEYNEEYPRYIRITDIDDNNKLKEDGKLSLLPVIARPYILQDNDILFARSGASVGKTFLYKKKYGKAAFAGYLIKAHLDISKVVPKYVYYSTLSTGYDNWKNAIFTQATIQNIGADKYSTYQISIPSINEQQKIVEYLDKKCIEMDALSVDIQSQINILEDYKKSVITETVTKGLNPDVEVENSGLEWIGKIPKHWEVNKIKYLFKNGKGLSITKENLTDEGLAVVSYGQIHSKTNTGVTIESDLLRFVDYKYQKYYPQCQVYKYDFIFADTSEDYEGCGNCVYKRDDSLLFAGYHSIILHSIEQQDNRYFAYLFKTDCWRKQIREVASGVKLFSITRKALINSSLIIPPTSEQCGIADYLDQKCSEIDDVIIKKKKQLEIIEQYKKSMIEQNRCAMACLGYGAVFHFL